MNEELSGILNTLYSAVINYHEGYDTGELKASEAILEAYIKAVVDDAEYKMLASCGLGP